MKRRSDEEKMADKEWQKAAEETFKAHQDLVQIRAKFQFMLMVLAFGSVFFIWLVNTYLLIPTGFSTDLVQVGYTSLGVCIGSCIFDLIRMPINPRAAIDKVIPTISKWSFYIGLACLACLILLVYVR